MTTEHTNHTREELMKELRFYVHSGARIEPVAVAESAVYWLSRVDDNPIVRTTIVELDAWLRNEDSRLPEALIEKVLRLLETPLGEPKPRKRPPLSSLFFDDDLRERYQSEPFLHAVVDQMVSWLVTSRITMVDLARSAVLAAQLYSERYQAPVALRLVNAIEPPPPRHHFDEGVLPSSPEPVPLRNGEGLTFPEWLAAACKLASSETRLAWLDGVDPTEFRSR